MELLKYEPKAVGSPGTATRKQDSNRPRPPSLDEAYALLQDMAHLVFDHATRDSTTSLYSLGYLKDTLNRELARAARSRRSIIVFSIDVDNFAQFNVEHDHQTGNFVLRKIATFIRKHSRLGDWASRPAGDQFVLVAPELSLTQAVNKANQIIGGISQLRLSYRGRRLPIVTVSIGVASFPDHAKSTAGILRAADAALHRAKADKNCVAVASELQIKRKRPFGHAAAIVHDRVGRG